MSFLGKTNHGYAKPMRLKMSVGATLCSISFKKESSIKASIRRKRFKALMDNNYLFSIFQAI
jgi:hypothetical protein